MNATNRWWLELRPDRGGHKFFFDLESDPDTDRPIPLEHRVAIADCSGDTPDQTEDGILYLDRSRPITLDTDWRGTCVIPLKRPDGTTVSTFASLSEARAVAKRFSMEVYSVLGLPVEE